MYGSLIAEYGDLGYEARKALNRATCGTCKAIRRNLGSEYIGLPFGDSIGINVIGRALGASENKSDDYSSAVHGLGAYIKSLDTWKDNDSLLRNVGSRRCEKLPEKVDQVFSRLEVPFTTKEIAEQTVEGMKREEEFKNGVPYTLKSILEKTAYPVTASFEGLSDISGKPKTGLHNLGYSIGVILSINDAKKDLKRDKGKFNVVRDFKADVVSRAYDSAVEAVDLSWDLFDKEPYETLAGRIFDNVRGTEPSRSAVYEIRSKLTSKPAMAAFMLAPFAFKLVNVAAAQGVNNDSSCVNPGLPVFILLSSAVCCGHVCRRKENQNKNNY